MRRWCAGRAAIRSTVTTGVDNALTGMGGQRAVQILDDPYGDGTREQLPESRRLHARRLPGTYSTLKPFTFVNPVTIPERPGADAARSSVVAHAPVPVGDVQRASTRQLQRADHGAEQRELRPDPDRRRSAYHAVRPEGTTSDRRELRVRATHESTLAAVSAVGLLASVCDARAERLGPLRPGPGRDEILHARADHDRNVSSLAARVDVPHRRQVRLLREHAAGRSTAWCTSPRGTASTRSTPSPAQQLWKVGRDAHDAPRSVVLAGRREHRRRGSSRPPGTQLMALDPKTGKPVEAVRRQGGSVELERLDELAARRSSRTWRSSRATSP